MGTVVATAPESDSSFRFTLDKGTDDGVMPSSVVAVPEGALELTWVSEKGAGGYVRGVKNPDEAANALRRLPYEAIQCKAK